MVLTVHDSILFELPETGWEPIAHRIRSIMQDHPWCTLPMVVDVKLGQNWGSMKELPRDPVGIPKAALARLTGEARAAFGLQPIER